MWETWVQSLGWEDPLEKGKATRSSILAWRIPWTVKSTGCQRVRHDWMTFAFTFHFILWFLNVDVQPCHLPLYHSQLIFVHGHKLPGSYAILFFSALDCTFWHQPHPQLSFPLCPRNSFLLMLLVIALCCPQVIYWTPSNLGVLIFQHHIFIFIVFSFSYYPWRSPGKNTGWAGHFLVQDLILSELFTMTHLLWWPCPAWLMASSSYASLFATIKLWSMKWSLLCDSGNKLILAQGFIIFQSWDRDSVRTSFSWMGYHLQ